MGRIAGPTPKLSILNARKRELERQRVLKKYARPTPMSAVPPARKRQLALLWVLSNYRPMGLPVGYKEMPPYTQDMRELVRKGLASYKRVLTLGRSHNLLSVSDKGRQLVSVSKITDELILYIGNAFGSSSIR
jgi:hypothetical protein